MKEEQSIETEYFFNAHLYQGLKQTETVYRLTPYSSFVASAAALILTAYSILGFAMSRFQDLRIDALLLKQLYRQIIGDQNGQEAQASSSSDSSDSSDDESKKKSSTSN